MLETIRATLSAASMTDWFLVFLGFIVLLYIYGSWNYDFFTVRGLPSTSPRWPVFGDTGFAFLSFVPLQNVLQELYDKGKGHSIFGIFEFRRPIYMIRDPEIIKQVTVKDFDHFINHRPITSSENGDPIFTKSLFAQKDQRWRDMRATLSPVFTTSKLKHMFELISQCGEQVALHLREKFATDSEGCLADNGKKVMSTDMKDIFSRMANDVIATTAFGMSCDSLKQPKNMFITMAKRLTNMNGWRSFIFGLSICFPKLAQILKLRILDPKSVDFFESVIRDTMEEREKKNIFRPDLLQLLMQARVGELEIEVGDEQEEEKLKSNKGKLTDAEVTAQALLFFFAGSENIATAICLSTYLLAMNPRAQESLQAEIDEAIITSNGKLTYEVVQGMKYLDMVLNETFRIIPPGPSTDRQCSESFTIPATDKRPAVTFRPGDIIWLPILGIHHDPEYWPEPEEFIPERFSDENKHKIQPFTYLPFGLGPRICIAQRFALLEIKVALVHLLANFNLHPSSKVHFPLQFENGFNIMIKGGFWCDLEKRER